MSENKDQFCIIRCDRAGVFFAKVAKRIGQEALLTDCRRIWYWAGAASLSQLAMEGTKDPESCRFTVTVPSMIVTDVTEIIPCTDAAAQNIQAVKEWKI